MLVACWLNVDSSSNFWMGVVYWVVIFVNLCICVDRDRTYIIIIGAGTAGNNSEWTGSCRFTILGVDVFFWVVERITVLFIFILVCI